MDESALVRAGAVQAWERVPVALVQHFPDLFFEAVAVSLSDPYVVVHKSATQSLRRREIPKGKRHLVKSGLLRLISHYAKQDKTSDFIVDCIDTFSFLCLSEDDRKGQLGSTLADILFRLEEGALYRAIDRLGYRFRDVPGFSKVAIKALQDDYTRSISIERAVMSILSAPAHELRSSFDELQQAFETLRPPRPEQFYEALVLAAALSRGGANDIVGALFEQLLDEIPVNERNKLWRLDTALVATAARIECTIREGNELSEMKMSWSTQVQDSEKEHDERSKLRDFPPDFLVED